MSDLRPCPFCGTKHIDKPQEVGPGLELVVMPHGTSWVKCHECGIDGPAEVSGPKKGIATRAIALWNTRATDAQADKLAALLDRVWHEWDKDQNGSPTYGTMAEIKAALAEYEDGKPNPSDQRAGASPAPSESRC